MSYRTSLNQTMLRSEYDRTVGGWGKRTLRSAETQAIATAPRRGGYQTEHLSTRHRVNFGTAFASGGNYTLLFSLWNDASYALYVHEGTASPILGGGEDGRMWFPGSEVGAGYAWLNPTRVRGQRANPWMADALEYAFAFAGLPGTKVIDRG